MLTIGEDEIKIYIENIAEKLRIKPMKQSSDKQIID